MEAKVGGSQMDDLSQLKKHEQFKSLISYKKYGK